MIYLNKFIKVNQLCGYLDKQYFLKQLSTQLLAIQQQYTYKGNYSAKTKDAKI